MPDEFPSPHRRRDSQPLYIYPAQDASTIIIIQVTSCRQPHNAAGAYRLFQTCLAFGASHHARTHPATKNAPLLPLQNSHRIHKWALDMSTYTRPNRNVVNLLPLQNCQRLHNGTRHESSPLVRAGPESNLLPLQNYHRTHFHASHESLRSSRSEQHRLYYPFKTQRGPTLPPSTSLCTIFGKNITTSYYPYKTPKLPMGTRTLYEALLFSPSILLPQLVEPRRRRKKKPPVHFVTFYAFLRRSWVRVWGGRAIAQQCRQEPPQGSRMNPGLFWAGVRTSFADDKRTCKDYRRPEMPFISAQMPGQAAVGGDFDQR